MAFPYSSTHSLMPTGYRLEKSPLDAHVRVLLERLCLLLEDGCLQVCSAHSPSCGWDTPSHVAKILGFDVF